MNPTLSHEVAVRTVWMTKSGYPAIINEISSSHIHGAVVSPSGTIACSWSRAGENLLNKPDFFDLAYPPSSIQNKYAVIKGGALIGSAPSKEDASEMREQNEADLVCKYSELIEFI